MQNKKKTIFSFFLILIILSLSVFLFFRNGKEVEATWWNDAWQFRKALTINSSQVAGDLSDFPVLVSFTDTDLIGHAQVDGDDFVFIDKEGNKLSHEIEKYASSTGELIAWVKISELSSTVDSDIYLYYGNAGISNQEDVENVWDDDFKLIQHLEETASSTRYDSTRNNNDGTTYNYDDNEATTTAKIDGGDYLDGTSDAINYDGLGIIDTYTAEAWIKPEDLYGTGDNATMGFTIMAASRTSTEYYPFWFSVFGTELKFWAFESTVNGARLTSDANIATSTWFHVVATASYGTTSKVYVNGVEKLSFINDADVSWSEDFTIGDLRPNRNIDFYGTIDEVRMSDVIRSAEWIETEYNNQNDPTLFFTVQDEEVGPGPVSYWTFDEGYGTTAYDESSQKNDGTISGATWTDESQCVSGKCLYFDGSDDYIEVADDDSLDITDAITVSLWAKPMTVSGYTAAFRTLLSKDVHNSQPYGFYWDSSAGELEFVVNNGSDRLTLDYDYDSHVNEWNHFVVRYDQSTIEIYVNGNLLGSTDYSTVLPVDTEALRIGWDGDGTSDRYFKGFIDEVKIYPYARTADQVKQDYNAGLAGQKSDSGVSVAFGAQSESWISDDLIGYWKFDETATTSGTIDSSGNGNDGTFEGAASTTVGKFKNSYVGATSTDAVDFGDISSYNVMLGEQKSFSAWFKAGTQTDYSKYILWKEGNCTGWSLFLDTNGYVKANIKTSVSGCADYNSHVIEASDASYDNDEWQHAVLLVDRINNFIRLYVNGEEKDSMNIDDNNFTNNPDFTVGNNWNSSRAFDGQIDEVRIYNRILSKKEIRDLYEWAPGPVFYLKMDEMSGTTAYDVSGYENYAIKLGAVENVIGKYGGALSFNGNSGVYSIGSPTELDNLRPMTMSAWIYPLSYGEGTGSVIFGKTSGSVWVVVLGLNNSNNLVFGHRGENGFYVSNSSESDSIEYNKWQHVVATWDGGVLGSGVNLYINGVLNNGSLGNTDALLNDSIYSFYVGNNASYSATFDGKIDELKVYNYVRTQKQILEDMNAGAPAHKSPVLHLSFDEGYGETVHDSSIYGNDGVAYVGDSGDQTATSSMWEKSGRVGGAIGFDGTDDYVSISNSASLNPIEEIAISVWVKFDDLTKHTVLMKPYTSHANPYYQYTLLTDSNNHFVTWIDGVSVSSSQQHTTNVWYNWIVTWDGEIIKQYINSELDGSGLQSSMNIYSTNFEIGRNTNVSTDYINGLIDEVKIWNYAINEDEIKQEYNFGVSAGFGYDASRDSNGTTTTGASKEYCIPGDTAQCDPPILELKMDEMAGGTVYDTSGNGNDGTMYNMATSTNGGWDLGKHGSALSFDGVDDYVLIEDDSSFTPINGMTIQAWTKIDLSSSDTYIIASKYRDPDDEWFFSFNKNITRKLSFFIKDDSNSGYIKLEAEYSSDVSDEWHFVVATYDGGDTSSSIKLYVDGQYMLDTISSDIGTFVSVVDGDTPIKIGQNGSDSYWFDGQIDDMRIYDYVRTPAQIAYDYNRGKAIAEYKFDECYGSTIHNYADNSLHGALTLGSISVTTPGVCASSSNSFWSWGNGGKHNSAGMFDGRDDYVDIGDTGMDINTVSFWWTGNVASSSIADLDGGTHTITISENTVSANGFTSPTIYIDGITGSTLPNNNWHHIAIKTDTAIDVNDLDIGRASSQYLNGFIDDFKLYNYALTATQIKSDYSGSAISLGDDSGWTCGSDKLTDIDGNEYETVLIGDQCWMAQNLMVSRNADGSAVNGTGDADTTPPAAYGDSDGGHDDADADWEAVEGYLYNWQDAMNGSTATSAQGICPDGWHIPSHFEWTDLERYICEKEGNGSCDTTFPKDFTTTGYLGTNEGTELKAIDNVNGVVDDPNGDDGYGYSASLSGGRFLYGAFGGRGSSGFFWSSSEAGSNAWYRSFYSSNSNVYRVNINKTYGFSVRCIRD
jgi:uncharacterized protein (TIGR02145 family)